MIRLSAYKPGIKSRHDRNVCGKSSAGRTDLKRKLKIKSSHIQDDMWSYDAISRITSEVNPLGTFGYTYVDQTPTDKGVTRLSSISYPNGQTTNFSWLANIGDQRLQQIANLNPSSTIISQFNQAYDSAGEIKQWLQNQNSTNTHLSLGYDQASQLTGSTSDEGSQSNVYISGTPHAGDVVSLTAYDASLTGTTPKGQETATYLCSAN